MLQPSVTIYPLLNYSFGTKDGKDERDFSIDQRMKRLRASFERDGMRRSVEGVLVVHEHGHPHVLLLQVTPTLFKLPGGRLRPGEDEHEGLRRKLTTALSPENPVLQTVWDVGECVGMYWRPNFDTVFYPYTPPHVSRPKECKKVFIVLLPDKAMFAVPKSLRLVAVPLFELYDNMARYGPIISVLPQLLSRFRINTVAAIHTTSSLLSSDKKTESIEEKAKVQAVAVAV